MCDAFYSNLNVSKKCKTEINILGDFNAKAGNQQFDDTVGNHRLGESCKKWQAHRWAKKSMIKLLKTSVISKIQENYELGRILTIRSEHMRINNNIENILITSSSIFFLRREILY